MNRAALAAAFAVLVACPRPAAAEFLLRVEGQTVVTARNDVRIPGDGGTRFSLTDDLEADRVAAWRAEAGWVRRGKDYFGVTVAPLEVESRGRFTRDVLFDGRTFPAGQEAAGTFRFDSYRFTWRHKLLESDRFSLWAGATAKVRDAAISLRSGSLSAEKDNTGFVPLVSFLGEARLNDRFTLTLSGDALVAPQGRAEDVLFAVSWRLSDRARVFSGYRILEGGADNDEVYTFSLFHYGVLGVEVGF